MTDASPAVHLPNSQCILGVAQRDVTPPMGIYHRMWGAAAHDRATGVHRPLRATAVVFRPVEHPAPDRDVVLVALDHCLLWARELDALRNRVAVESNLALDRLLVTFSHTHAAGLMGLERRDLPGGDLIPSYLDELARAVVDAVREARRAAQPVGIVYGSARCNLAANRDLWDDRCQQFVCGFNPNGRADDTVLTARATGADGRTVATFVNYACHPTTLAWQNTQISPDYPGAMREVVERETRCVCLFLQGASGDLGPREGFVGDAAVADRNGRQLGFAALSAIESLPMPGMQFQYTGPVVSGATIGSWEYRPVSASVAAQHERFEFRSLIVALAYRADLPTLESASGEFTRWQTSERTADGARDPASIGETRARVERARRLVNRLSQLPVGQAFPMPVAIWRLGDAVWVAVEGEHYQYLQTSLRSRFPGRPLMVITLTNGARPAYLPTQESYGRGIYQESIAVLERGSLERLVEAISGAVAELFVTA